MASDLLNEALLSAMKKSISYDIDISQFYTMYGRPVPKHVLSYKKALEEQIEDIKEKIRAEETRSQGLTGYGE